MNPIDNFRYSYQMGIFEMTNSKMAFTEAKEEKTAKVKWQMNGRTNENERNEEKLHRLGHTNTHTYTHEIK